MTSRRPPATWFSLSHASPRPPGGLGKLTPRVSDADLAPVTDAIMWPGPVESWPGMRFELVEGGFADYQPVNKYVQLFSVRLRDLIDELSPATPVEWLPALVASDAEERTYWIPSLTEEMDIFQEGQVNRMPDGRVIGGYFDHHKLARYRFAGFVGGGNAADLYGHRELREAAAERGVDSGIEWFEVDSFSWHQEGGGYTPEGYKK